MKPKRKRIMGLFLALVMLLGCLPFNTIETYAAGEVVVIDNKTFPDEKFRNYVKVNIDSDNDNILSQDECDAVTTLNIDSRGIASLKGIEYFTKLENLSGDYNNLTSLDLSKNTELINLSCRENKLTNLNVKNATNLKDISCIDNELTTIDLSSNTNLRFVLIRGNKITSLDPPNDFAKLAVGAHLLSGEMNPYYIAVDSSTKKFKYSVLPGKFDPNRVVDKIGIEFEGDFIKITETYPDEGFYKCYYRYSFNKWDFPVRLYVKFVDKKVTIGHDPTIPKLGNIARLIFDAGEGNTIDGANRYKVIDVLKGTKWDDPDVKKQIPKNAICKDTKKVFIAWDRELGDDFEIEDREYKAYYKYNIFQFNPTSADNPVDERDAKIPDKYKIDGKLDTTKYSIISFKLPEKSRFIYMGKLGEKNYNAYPVEDEFFGSSFEKTTSFIIPKQILWGDFRRDQAFEYENSPVAVYTFNRSIQQQGIQFEFYGFKNGLPNDGDVLNNGRIFEADFRLKEKITLSREKSSKIDNYFLISNYQKLVKAPVSVGYGTIKAYGNGGKIDGKDDHEIYANVGYNLTFAEIIKHLPDPYREGYKFKYWSEKPEEGSPAIDGTKIFNFKTEGYNNGQFNVYAQYEQGLPDIIENPTKPTPQGYVRVTFKAGEGIEKLNSTKFYDVRKGTSLREAYYPEVTLKATHENLVWSVAPGTPINDNTEIVATASSKGLLKIGTDPNAPVLNGYIRVTFDAGENNTIDGENRYKVIDVLTGTGWDNDAVKGQIPTTATCNDTTKEFDNWNEKVPTIGRVEAKTFTAKYKFKKKVVEVDSTSSTQEGYVRIMFSAADGLVDGKATKAFDVLKGTTYGDIALKDIIEKLVAVPRDTTKEFNKWTPDVIPTDQVENNKIFIAAYKSKPKFSEVTDPDSPVPAGYVRLKFDAKAGTINGKAKVAIDVLNGTTYKDAELKEKIAAIVAVPTDTTQEFEKWDKQVPTTGNVATETFTAIYKDVAKVVGPVDPTQPGGKPADPSKYYVVTFVSADTTKGTVDAKNTAYVLKTETKTLADITAPKTTAVQGYEFEKWEPALDANTTIAGDMEVKAYFKQAGTPTPQNPPVVGPVDPTQPGGKPADPSKYYVVTFVSADTTKGTVDAKNTAYVLKTETKTLADITAPKTTAVQGYEFEKWEPALDANTTIAGDMEVKAYFKQAGTPTPQNPPVVGPVDPTQPGGKPADPSKYYVVTFVSENENKGTVAKANTVYVPMRAGITFADLARFAPVATPYYGYEFAGWSPYLYGNPTIIERNMVIYARFEEPYTPSYPDPYERRRPRRKYTDRYDRYDRDDNKEEKIEEAKVYDKLEVILFINNTLMQKSVNGVVSQVRMDIAPFIYQSRTMLPIRFVAEALGFMVTWDANTRTVYLVDKENIVQIPVDTNNIIVNGNTFVSDVKPIIKNNRTMLPVANIARALGLVDGKDILWDAVTKQVTITRMVEK